MLERMWRKKNTPPLLVELQAGTGSEVQSSIIKVKIWQRPGRLGAGGSEGSWVLLHLHLKAAGRTLDSRQVKVGS